MCPITRTLDEPQALGHGHVGSSSLFSSQLSAPSTRPPHAEHMDVPSGKRTSAYSVFMSSNFPPFGPVPYSQNPQTPPLGDCKHAALDGAELHHPFRRVNSWFGQDVLSESPGALNRSPAELALDTLALSGEEDACQQAAARSVANLALLPDMNDALSSKESLDILAESMRTRSSECVGRFIAMAVGRLAAGREVAQRLLAHDALLAALVVVANKSGGEWKQAARAMAVLTKRAADAGARARLMELGGVGPVLRLTQVNQTELQVDALCGLAAWCQDEAAVAELASRGAWAAILAATSSRANAAPTTSALCAETLLRALQTAPRHVALTPADLELVAAEVAGAGHHRQAYVSVLYRLAELGRAGPGGAVALGLSLLSVGGARLAAPEVRACVAFATACLAGRAQA